MKAKVWEKGSAVAVTTGTALDGCWRQEWRGTFEGHPYEAIVFRTNIGTWRWSYKLGRRRPTIGGAPTFDLARRAVLRAAEARSNPGGGSR